MYGILFNYWQGMFHSQHDESQGHGNDLHHWNLDNDSDKWRSAVWGSVTVP
jgi:hypothetical protein